MAEALVGASVSQQEPLLLPAFSPHTVPALGWQRQGGLESEADWLHREEPTNAQINPTETTPKLFSPKEFHSLVFEP